MNSAQDSVADERRLVERLRNGDHASFEIVVRKYGPRMLSVARRFLLEEDARDAVQDAMISAFKGINNFAGDAQLSTWLHRIVVNASLMRLRYRGRRKEDSLEDLLPQFDDAGKHLSAAVDAVDSLDQVLERRDRKAMVRKCIGMLPDNYRIVLLLRDIEDMSTNEVAEVLSETPNTVKVRLHRARQALRTIMLRELHDTENAALTT